MIKVKRTCACGTVYAARKADLDRGWGMSCSKSCAAKRREKFPSRAVAIRQAKYAKMRHRQERRDDALYQATSGECHSWSPFSNETNRQNS